MKNVPVEPWPWQCRQVLAAMRSEVLGTVRRFLQRVKKPGPVEIERLADGEGQGEDRVSRFLVRQAQALSEIEQAMHRFDTGTYGRCEACGDPISAVFLQAMPWTRVCDECWRGQISGRPVAQDNDDLIRRLFDCQN
ncbi:MAG: hypothetical protein GXY33_06610 [Phycisphaerae bacterium]|nr:hypothetical protein [Phycisphaerae bacterium]